MKKHLLILRELSAEYQKRIPKQYECRFVKPTDITIQDMQWAEVIAGNPPIELLKNASNLKLLQLETAGNEQYVKEIGKDCVLCNASGSFGLAISEYLLGTILMLMRNLHIYQRHQEAHTWQTESDVTSLYGSVILLCGTGDLGQEFARKAKALGAKTIGIRRHPECAVDGFDELYATSQIKEVLPQADVVVLTLPKTAQTDGYFRKEYYAYMKKGAILANVGRGNAVDLMELISALHTYPLRGAILDVMSEEPLAKEHPLWQEERVIITPHISGTFQLPESFHRYMEILLANLQAYALNEPLRNVVDISQGY